MVERSDEPGSADGVRGDAFRVIALICAYNEGDILRQVLSHLSENDVDFYVMDHHSTDDTVAAARAFEGRGLVGIETFPDAAGFPAESANTLVWRQVLRRKEQLARELQASWFIHHDADEVRESPFPGLNLKQALHWVDSRGYNCVDFELYNFWPIDNDWQERVSDPRSHFRLCDSPPAYDAEQRKAWRSTPEVDLYSSAGHNVTFPGARAFPIRFILRHYRIRSDAHGRRKVMAERVNRFDAEELSWGWHIQYDELVNRQSFLRDPSTLREFDLEEERLRLLLESRRPE